MTKPPPKFCKDVEGIAALAGVKLVSRVQRKRRLAQLAEVRSWTGQAEFPQKQKNGYWLRSELVAWLEKRKAGIRNQKSEIGKGKKRESEIGNLKSESSPQAELFSPPDFSRFSPDKQKRLLGLYQKWLEPTTFSLKESELRELRAVGAIPADPTPEADDGGDIIYGGQEGIAEFIRREFKTECHQVYVSDWLKGKRLPPGAQPMPPPHVSGRHKKSVVGAWYRTTFPANVPENGLALVGGDWRAQREKADAERATLELELRRKQISEKFLPAEDVGGFVEALGVFMGQQQDILIEDAQGVRRVAGGLVTELFAPTPEALAVFDGRLAAGLRQLNDAMKAGVRMHSGDLLKQLAEDRKEAVAREIKN